MNQPLVSICIPTYNRPELLARTLRSCETQTYRNFEIIICDNSDNDASGELVSRLNDPRIRYYKNDENIGGIRNFIKAVDLAKGKYVNILMDDILKPRALELMVAAFEEHPSVGVVMAPMELIDENDKRIFPYFYVFRKMYYRYRFQVGDGLIDRRKILKEFLVHDYPCCVPSGLLYRTEALQKTGPFDLRCDFAIDLDMCMRIAVNYDFYYIDQALSGWRYIPVGHTSMLHQKGLNVGVFYFITRKILANPAAMNLFPAAEHPKLIRDSIYFCTCRALLNGLAGLRARSSKLIKDTLWLIAREDKYLWNKLRLPWFILREIFLSFIPPAKPLPKD